MREEAFQGLLNALHEDEQLAAVEYKNLHQRLVRFFEWNGVEDPLALADAALDRLGKRIAESTEADSSTPDAAGGVRNAAAFALGIARHLLQEEARRQQQAIEISRHLKSQEPLFTTSSESEELELALQSCLAKLAPDRRQLLEAYYTYAEGEKIKAHQKMADSLGLSLNALRNRVLRSRQELEDCMRQRPGEKKR